MQFRVGRRARLSGQQHLPASSASPRSANHDRTAHPPNEVAVAGRGLQCEIGCVKGLEEEVRRSDV
jgi:hypothetical protein